MFSDDNKSETVWQIFDHPVDTLLPGTRFGGQQKLVSWKSSLGDPAPGLFSYQVDPSGVKQFVLTWNNSVQYWASGTCVGNVFRQIPEITNKGLYNISVENTNSALYITYTSMAITNVLSHFVLVKSGGMQLYALLDDAKWSMCLVCFVRRLRKLQLQQSSVLPHRQPHLGFARVVVHWLCPAEPIKLRCQK